MEYLLYGVIIIFGLYWQTMIFSRNNDNVRMFVPIRIGLVSTVLMAIYGFVYCLVYSFSDESVTLWFVNFWHIFLIGIYFNIKAFVGPFFVTVTLVSLLYQFFHTGSIEFVGVFQNVIEYLFMYLPSWVENLYLIGSFIIIFIGSVKDYDFDLS
jgi:hypothetical protein